MSGNIGRRRGRRMVVVRCVSVVIRKMMAVRDDAIMWLLRREVATRARNRDLTRRMGDI